MKKYIISGLILLAVATYAWATLSSVTQSGMGRNVQSFTQTQTVVGVAGADIFTARNVAAYTNWTIWVFNTGAGALTDLNILISDENANWDDAREVIASTLGASNQSTDCTVTLGADTKCVYILSTRAPIGWIELTATATTTTETKVVFIGRIE